MLNAANLRIHFCEYCIGINFHIYDSNLNYMHCQLQLATDGVSVPYLTADIMAVATTLKLVF